MIPSIERNWTDHSNYGRDFIVHDFAVLHGTGHSPDTTFDNLINYMLTPGIQVSYHYVIDTNGRIVELVPPTNRAFHAGVSRWNDRTDLNYSSIGIAFFNTNLQGDDITVEQVNAAIALLNEFKCKETLTHKMVAPERKNDPDNLTHSQYQAIKRRKWLLDSAIFIENDGSESERAGQFISSIVGTKVYIRDVMDERLGDG